MNGERADWEHQLGPALTAIRNNVSVVNGFSPFMLHHARPARHATGRMIDGSMHPEWSECLSMQADQMAHASEATKQSCEYNHARLAAKANAKELEPSDAVMVLGQR